MTALLIAASAAVAALAVVRLGFLRVRVAGPSMLPTYRPGARVLALRRGLGRPIRTGDVVVCRPPAGYDRRFTPLLVKRVAAMAGETGPAGRTVPPRHVFLLGDGPVSVDSRQFGPLPLGLVVARVVSPGAAD
ncbi:S26 family signal peptidase [Dactylosporangium sp. NPDC051541]|uniref:S26 family signal peptidase n=1 Tax=Dactylosporangium sp. NPDC051541 TaxID=3363977 RepID=UPI0037A53254